MDSGAQAHLVIETVRDQVPPVQFGVLPAVRRVRGGLGKLRAYREPVAGSFGVLLERRDRDMQPAGERQGGEQAVELGLAAGAVQPDRRCPVAGERPSPEPDEMPVLRELGRGG